MNVPKVCTAFGKYTRFSQALFTGSVKCFSKEPGGMPDTPGNMEKTLNQVTLLGRVGGEPQKRGNQQHPVVIFSLATHTNYKYESGEFAQKTDWHRICVFKPSLREVVFSYLRKGQRVYVTGKISYSSVSEDSVQKPTTSIIADDIIFFQSGDS